MNDVVRSWQIAQEARALRFGGGGLGAVFGTGYNEASRRSSASDQTRAQAYLDLCAANTLKVHGTVLPGEVDWSTKGPVCLGG